MVEIDSKEIRERITKNDILLKEIITGVDKIIVSDYSLSVNDYFNNIEKFFQFYEDDRKKPAPPFIPDDQKKYISQIPNPFSELRNKMHLFQAEEKEIERLKGEEDRLRQAGIIEPAYLMTRLEKENPRLYKALCKAIADGLVKVTDDKRLNFICKIGSMAHFFKEGGFKDCKILSEYIKINGEETKVKQLRSAMDNEPPKNWDLIKEKYYLS
jgi:hypothetical protein